MADSNEINMEEMNDLIEEIKEIYGTLREQYLKEDADDTVKNDFSSLDKMMSNMFAYNTMSIDSYLENMSDFTTGIHYLELDLDLGNSDQIKITKYMVLLNNFTLRCMNKYHNLFKK